MSNIYHCPNCSSELGVINEEFRCWNSNCGFRSSRPWVSPPLRKSDVSLSCSLEKVVGELLHAAANGPFFISKDVTDDPYWEFETLLGFSHKEVATISSQWPNVDFTEEHISNLIAECFFNLLYYPHGFDELWSEYFSVSKEELAKLSTRWKQREYC